MNDEFILSWTAAQKVSEGDYKMACEERERQLLQALHEIDDVRAELNAYEKLATGAAFSLGIAPDPDTKRWVNVRAQDAEAALAAANLEIENLRSVISTPEIYAGVVTEECEKYWAELIKAANRRAEEAFNKGVEAAASYVEYAEADYLAGVVSHIRALKRPTQPEQTQKEQGE